MPSAGLGASFEKMSSSSATPVPFFAEVKHTGIRWLSRRAFSNGACSSSGDTSPLSRYTAMSASSTSTTWSTSAPCAAFTEEKSDSPSGLKKQSTIRVPPCAGRLIGRHSLPNISWIDASTEGRSTFSASILLTTIMRQRFRAAAHFIIRTVLSSIPDWALITTAAVSTPASALIAWPEKSG